MPAKNDDLLTAIKRISTSTATREEKIAALDDILKIDFTVSASNAKDKIQKALIASIEKTHQSFWNIARDPSDADDAYLNYDAPPNFDAIKKAAAEQRVLLGMQNAEDDVLISMLGAGTTANAEALRSYINDRPEFDGLRQAPGWASTASPPQPGIHFIADESRDPIRAEAAALLIKRRISAFPDIDAANEAEIGGALTDDDELKNLVRRICTGARGIDDDIIYQQEYFQQTLGVRYLQYQLINVLNPTIADLNRCTDKDSLIVYLKSTALGDNEYIDSAVTDQNFATLKTAALEGYIKRSIELDDWDNLTALNTAKDLAEFKKHLTDKLGLDPTDWITDSEMKTLKKAIAARMEAIRAKEIENIKEAIEQADSSHSKTLFDLANTDALPQFKNKLAGLFRPPKNLPWLDNTESLKKIQTLARGRVLALKVAELSYDEGARPALIKALNTLSPERQLELLDPKNKDLRHLIAAKDTTIIQHYMGKPLAHEVLNAIAEEAKRIAMCKKIHNRALAAVLAKQGASLGEGQVQAINECLKDMNPSGTNDFDKTKDRIAHIAFPAEVDKMNALRAALDDDARTAMEALKAQNKNLHELYHDPATSSTQKVFLPLLLNLPKTQPPVVYAGDKMRFRTGLNSLIEANTRVEQFINALCSSPDIVTIPPGGSGLKSALRQELTQEVYDEIVALRRKEVLSPTSTASPLGKATLLATIKSEFKTLKEQVDPLLKIKLAEAPNGDALKGVAFAEHVRAQPKKIKANYIDLLEGYSLHMDQLERHKNKIKRHLDSLPDSRSGDPSIEKLRTQLEAHALLITKRIEAYERARSQVLKTLEQIDKITLKNERHLYHGIKFDLMDDTTLSGLRDELRSRGPSASSAPAVPLTVVSGASPAAVIRSKEFGEQRHCVCTITEEAIPLPPPPPRRGAPPPPPLSPAHVEGKFVQTFSEGRSGEPKCKMEVLMQPNLSGYDTSAAKVTFNMDMAISMIAANGGKPPTKDNPIRLNGGSDEEMEALWTALYIVCKEKYKYSHAQIMDAIQIETGGFNPKQVMKKGWVGDPVFIEYPDPEKEEKTSLYHALFQKYRDTIVKTKLGHVETIIAESKKTKEVTAAEKSVSAFRGAMQKGRDANAAAEQVRKEEGVVRATPYYKP